ncbi:MAG TPA: CDP-alcohol phosphatidyltransferase family protein [Candidatus Omnitrophota bacterium]|nr:CDP-alcohol phosphatidyltransferase family protein [Candidatus Omnitrophota bacterium]
MLREKLYPKVVSILNSWADALNRKGVTPNQLTIAGVALSFLAGFCFSNSALLVGAVFMALGGVCDAVDGPLARLSGKESKFGAFFDSTMDRFADGFLFGGIALHFFNQDEPFWIAVSIGLIIASFGVSYAKARAENFIEKCSVGVFTRETRWAAVGIGILLPFLLKPLLLISFVGSVWTVYQRIMYTKNTLERPASAEADAAL